MDESDDDFKELCASFFQRVKKTGTKEVSGERKMQKSSNNTQTRSISKKTKQSATRSKTLPGTLKKPRSCNQTRRTKKQGATKSQESEPALPMSGERGMLAPPLNPAVLRDQSQSIQTENAPSGDSQPTLSCVTTTAVPSPSKPRTAELVLQRMQQFKRTDPERLQHASENCSLQATQEEDVPRSPEEEMVIGNGNGLGLPATDSDAAVALVLQQEFGREGAPPCDNSLEEKGLFFCQMCQKNLSAMSVTRREQHVNRCLDEAEKALGPSTPQIPECPICGKMFVTSKSRISHLKQCAVRMEVGPQLLLQAVRMQTSTPEASSSPLASSFSKLSGGCKRKGTSNKKEPQKRRRVAKPEVPSEDLLVAMALSRSEVEQGPAMPTLRLESAFSERTRPEKRSRKRKALDSPPQLVVQDSSTTSRQIEDRVAQLLSEEVELSCTPPLPASRILQEKLQEAGWCLQLPEGKENFLWEGSALTGAWAVESFYTAALVPPIVLQRPTVPELHVQRPPALHSSLHTGCSPQDLLLSASQRERQALQDLVDLAEEGLSASPWPSSGGLASSGGAAAGLELVPSGVPLTGFALSPKEKPLERDKHTSLSLGLLAADFGAMVNNPHLSDVQFQTDSGEVLYAHKFVLYARCPLLIQYVNSEGFSAIEDGEEAQRVLLSNVSAETACVFLRYLYTADTVLPPHLAPELGTLARRFGVNDLVHLCEQAPSVTHMDSELQEEKEDENCESRVENFQQLLRSMWPDEEEDTEILLKSEEDREKVNEADMEEIYEFVATQRKLLQGERVPDTDEESDQPGEDSPVAGPPLANVLGSKQLEEGEQLGLLGLGKYKAPVGKENVRHFLLLPKSRCSDGAADTETHRQTPLKEAPCPSSCSPTLGSEAGKQENFPVCSFEVPAYERIFSSAREGFSELSQITSDHQEQSGTVRGKGVGMACVPTPQPRPCWLPSGQSPSRSQLRLDHTNDSSPSIPHLHNAISKVSSPSSPAPARPSKQDSDILTVLKEPGHWKGRGCRSMLERKNKGVLISPEKSLPIDLTQSIPEPLSTKSQDPPSHMNSENEIILLLDSDEELELEQTKTKLVSNGPSEERNILEVSHKSSELFSVIDVDADQEHSQNPLRREAELQLKSGEGQSENQGALGTMPTWLVCDQESSLDEDSTTDASWLVPATPLSSRSRDCSSQTQITSLRTRPPGDKMAQPSSRATPENTTVSEATQKFSDTTPPMSPMPPGTAGSLRQVYRSPSRSQPRSHKFSSPRAPWPMAGALPDITGPAQEFSPGQATASEVVEVGDSEDEQEVSSQVNRSSPLDSSSLIPVNDCWNIEPLSPIPIDHLNLERTGPLNTSSPSSQAQESLDSGGCHSPGLLGSTPIRASGTARHTSLGQSSGAGSPAASRLSFLHPALWDDWDGEEQKSSDVPPAAQTPRALRAQTSEGPEMPKGANRKKNLPPKVPISPMPRYSIMETPVLKKELDRFGVRPLPKRQMVLKLKEIFQYTHQTLESDSEEETQSSQGMRETPCSQTLPTDTYKPSSVGGHALLEVTEGPKTQQFKGPQCQQRQPSQSIPHQNRLPAEKPPTGPDVDTQLPASQESVATSVDSSDSSFSSQSSSCEFGAAFESAGEDEDEGAGVSASQAARQALDTEEAVRRYIRSKPALFRKVLLYQPLELAELQAELKQGGIHVAMGKLLDTLDALCITFTTAATRKEKLKQKGQQQRGRRKGKRD